jgi:SAM-dependent methyltransferase
MKRAPDKNSWDDTALEMQGAQDFDDLLAEQYRRVHLDLIYRWCGDITGLKILKTDLFAEGLCPSRSFSWDLLTHKIEYTGIDISPQIVRLAEKNLEIFKNGSTFFLQPADIRATGFAGNSFDLVISDSTLDHFQTVDEITVAIRELVRILKPGGCLLITLDNKGNITDPLFQMWKKLKLSWFYIGETLTMSQLINEVSAAGMQVTDHTAILHNPRFFAKVIVRACRKLSRNKMDGRLRKWLASMDQQENRRTKYLTGQFIALKALKK